MKEMKKDSEIVINGYNAIEALVEPLSVVTVHDLVKISPPMKEMIEAMNRIADKGTPEEKKILKPTWERFSHLILSIRKRLQVPENAPSGLFAEFVRKTGMLNLEDQKFYADLGQMFLSLAGSGKRADALRAQGIFPLKNAAEKFRKNRASRG